MGRGLRFPQPVQDAAQQDEDRRAPVKIATYNINNINKRLSNLKAGAAFKAGGSVTGGANAGVTIAFGEWG